MKLQAALLVTSRGGAAFLQALLLILVARETSPTSFGLLGAQLGVITIFVMLVSVGSAQVVLRERAAGDSEHVRRALGLNTWTSSALVAVGLATLMVGGIVDHEASRWIISAGLLVLALTCEKNAEVRSALMVADLRKVMPALNLLARRFLSLLLFLPLVAVGGIDAVFGFGLAYVFGSLVGMIHANWMTEGGSLMRGRRLSEASAALKSAWPYLSNNLTSQARTLDVVVLASIAGPAQAGLYAAAYRFASPVLVVTTATATVMVPHAVRLDRQSVRRLATRLAIVLGVLSLVSLPAGMLIRPVLGSILGSDFAGAGRLLGPMVCSLLLVSLCTLLGSVLQAVGEARFVARIGVAFLPLLSIGVVVGSVAGGPLGALLGVIGTYAFRAIVLLMICRGRGRRGLGRLPARSIGASR